MKQEEHLAIKYAQYNDQQIAHIILNPNQYTEIAVLIAKLEAEKRDLPQSVFENYSVKQEKELGITIKLALIELSFGEKVIVYFLWMFKFLFAIFLHDAYKAGYELKLSQLRYYWFGGIIATMGGFAIANITDSLIMFFIVFLSGFFILRYFDIKLNRNKILEKYSISNEYRG